jgi:hypothetical protein
MAPPEDRRPDLLTGNWLPEPDGVGVHFFQGVRTTTRGSMVPMAEFVLVQTVEIGRQTGYTVCTFGRDTKWRLQDFKGHWLRVDVV